MIEELILTSHIAITNSENISYSTKYYTYPGAQAILIQIFIIG